MSLYTLLMGISFKIFYFTFFFGYIICHFVITPIFLKKYRNKSIFQSIIYEGLTAELTLKELMKETNDKYVKWTVKIIHYSKFIIVISLISGVIFAVIQS